MLHWWCHHCKIMSFYKKASTPCRQEIWSTNLGIIPAGSFIVAVPLLLTFNIFHTLFLMLQLLTLNMYIPNGMRRHESQLKNFWLFSMLCFGHYNVSCNILWLTSQCIFIRLYFFIFTMWKTLSFVSYTAAALTSSVWNVIILSF